mgnify:CR=1 FL=1
MLDNNVLVMTFPPGTTSVLQPLDVGVFGSLKQLLHDLVDAWSQRAGNPPISRRNIAQLVFRAWEERCTHNNIVAGFRASGVWDASCGVRREALKTLQLGPAAAAATFRAESKENDVKLSDLIDVMSRESLGGSSVPAAAAAAGWFHSLLGLR